MNNLKTGVVLNFIVEKNYGFIKEEGTGEEYFFFLDKKEQIQLNKKGVSPITYIRKGDVLRFDVRISQRQNKREAYNLIFVNNPLVDMIKSDIEKTGGRYGIINIRNERYYIYDNEFDVSFPVKILHNEKEFIDFDFLNTEPTVGYFLEQRKNPTKIYAKLKI